MKAKLCDLFKFFVVVPLRSVRAQIYDDPLVNNISLLKGNARFDDNY